VIRAAVVIFQRIGASIAVVSVGWRLHDVALPGGGMFGGIRVPRRGFRLGIGPRLLKDLHFGVTGTRTFSSLFV